MGVLVGCSLPNKALEENPMKLDEFFAYLREDPDWHRVEKMDISARGISGDTPLHAALWAHDDEAVRALVAAGADVNSAGEEGYSPLHVAVAQANASMARFLVGHGASWATRSEFGSSPLEDALRSENTEIRCLASKVKV